MCWRRLGLGRFSMFYIIRSRFAGRLNALEVNYRNNKSGRWRKIKMTNCCLLPLTFLFKLLQPDAHFKSLRMKLKQVKWRWSSIFHRETPAILEKDVTARMKSNKTSTRTAEEDINRTPRLPPNHNPTYKHHTPVKENRQHDTPPNPPTDITTLHPLKQSSSAR